MKKILITGGCGFLGTNLAKRLHTMGLQVIVADSLERKGADHNLKHLKEVCPTVVFDHKKIGEASEYIRKHKPDTVFHFAAQVAVTTSVKDPLQDFKTNAEGTFLVAQTCGELGIPLIYASTNKVYGDNVNKVPIRELPTRYDFDGDLKEKGIDELFSIDANHHTPYGVSKLVGEIYTREFGGVANRFSCMYGKHQHGIVDQGWLSFFVAQKLNGEQTTIFGDGKQIRDALHADDVIDLMVLQAERLHDTTKPSIKGEVFTIGGGYKNTISILELCKKLDITPQFADWRPADQKVFYCDITKAEKILGWKPKISLEQGLADLIQWNKEFFSR